MKGQVSVESREGKGSHFSIKLPICMGIDASDNILNPIDNEVEIIRNSECSSVILYVEDNPANLALVERIMGLSIEYWF